MVISDKSWDRYISLLRRINEAASEEMSRYLRLNEWYLNRESQQKAIDFAFALSEKYGEAAAEAACEFYDIIAEEWLGKVLKPAAPAATPTYQEVAKTINGILKTSQNEELLSSAVGRLVKQTGQDTTLHNALRDGAEFAWIPRGDTCVFCLTLASRGWQPMSRDALKNGHAEHIHSNCDCAYAVRFSSDNGVQGYDPEEYRKIWNSAEGSNSKQKLNYLRREAYAANRERINAQKRDAYAKSKELESSNAEEIDIK